MKKIGLIMLALVIALGTLGVGYAMWQDIIWIDGTVNTGELEIDVEYVSGCDVYKLEESGGIWFYYWVRDAVTGQLVHEVNPLSNVPETETLYPPAGTPLSYAYAEVPTGYTVDDDYIKMTWVNAFPTKYQGGARGLYADIIAHYTGTIPGHITWGWYYGMDAKADWLYDNGFIDVYAFKTEVTKDCADSPVVGGICYTVPGGTIPPYDTIQMHDCEYIKVNVYVDLPQPEEIPEDTGWTQKDFQDTTIDFWIYLYATQWNE
jgi:hypothetical protein